MTGRLHHLREDAVFVKRKHRVYSLPTTIQHWQLRDLVSSPTDGTVYTVRENSVRSFNTSTGKMASVLADLTFSPTSMAASCGYVAAGGQRSQLMVRSTETPWFAQTSVGGSINNALHITTLSHGETRLFVSNNDRTIKVFRLPTLARTATIPFPTAVNYASVSPDGRKLVAVGDSPEVYLYDIGSGSPDTFTLQSVLHTDRDASFSCAWSAASDRFAVASQDGAVSVWDVRSSHRCAVLGSPRSGQVFGACRNVKFSQAGGVDLLLYTEHVAHVSIVDARTFGDRQTLRVGGDGAGRHIAGAAFSPDARRIYVADEHDLYEYSVDTISRMSYPEGKLI